MHILIVRFASVVHLTRFITAHYGYYYDESPLSLRNVENVTDLQKPYELNLNNSCKYEVSL